jgi:hypothetical protein
MTEAHDPTQTWQPLPQLKGGVFVSMVTEVLDKENIPNMVKTDLESGGLGMIVGTETLGDPWKIFVPESDYDRAMQVFDSLMGSEDEGSSEEPSEPSEPTEPLV